MFSFTKFRAERLILKIKLASEPGSPAVQQAVARLQRLGPGAIAPVIRALPGADRHATVALVQALTPLINPRSFPQAIAGMVEGGARAASAVALALGGTEAWLPQQLLEALVFPGTPRAPLLEVVRLQKHRFTLRELLSAAHQQDGEDKVTLLRIVAEVATFDSVPELLSRLDGKDVFGRVQIINILLRFNTPEVRRALHGLLKDPAKQIRSTALGALAQMDGSVELPLVCALLRDPEIEVQNRAVDVLVHARDPETIRHLLPVLKDESEYARRAAVEVLNEIGDAKSVKDLLNAVKDQDWWVRSRAGDALGRIGGPRVIQAVLALVGDHDEQIRRAAIEILNQTRDPSAVDQLLRATRDTDWWVCERAVDALAGIGSRKALPRLLEMLATAPVSTLPAVLRAIGALALEADLASCRDRLEALQKHDEPAVAQAAAAVLPAALARAGTVAQQGGGSGQTSQFRPASTTAMRAALERAPADTVAVPATPVRPPEPAMQPGMSLRLDITALKPGDIIEGRYKFVERIGKGAFGTVLLVEDTVVDERLVLKFLNAGVAEDEEALKRFIHELRFSRKITHRNIIRIYDFLKIQGNYAISMEYFPSHTLGSEIINETPLALRRALKLAIDIARGMAVAHQAGVVHRDLKPANVLINDKGLVKVVDFGVAAAHREGDTQLTKTGFVIGSPKYMAPEQILGRKVDERADIYALGIMLYEMLSGVAPYTKGDHMAVMYQHVQGKAQPLLSLNPGLPPSLAEIVTKAMSVDKTRRFQSMDELRLALERFL
ncbi:MAG: hypothetical protein RL026_173 [Pseudomonadota bacterium]|jgi:serine/threonine-protein kinase